MASQHDDQELLGSIDLDEIADDGVSPDLPIHRGRQRQGGGQLALFELHGVGGPPFCIAAHVQVVGAGHWGDKGKSGRFVAEGIG